MLSPSVIQYELIECDASSRSAEINFTRCVWDFLCLDSLRSWNVPFSFVSRIGSYERCLTIVSTYLDAFRNERRNIDRLVHFEIRVSSKGFHSFSLFKIR